MESREVSADQLRKLISSGGLDDEVLYKVNNSLVITDTGDLETLSGNALVASLCPAPKVWLTWRVTSLSVSGLI